MWDPDVYLTFADHRGRPFSDLLSRGGAPSPRRVVDLGCGAGNLTGLLARRWPDAAIAASLNRMGLPTGHGKTWTAHRVNSVRSGNGIHAYRSAEKTGEWLTMSEAAAALGVTHHRIRRLIKDGVLPAEQVVPRAPYQIRAADLQGERVIAAITRTDRPCRVVPGNQLPMFPEA